MVPSMFEYSAYKPIKGKGQEMASRQSDHFVVLSKSRKRDGGKEVAETP
jgi:hypothetical protein